MSSSTATTGTTSQSASASRRWLARGAWAALVAAIVVLIAAEGLTGLTLTVVGLVGAAVMLAGGYWFIAKRGVLRWIGLALAAAAVVLVIVVFFRQGVVAVALVSLGLLVAGGALARAALRRDDNQWMPTTPARPAKQPFIVMNPRSGGGKVVRFDLKNKAEALGARGHPARRSRVCRRRRPGPGRGRRRRRPARGGRRGRHPGAGRRHLRRARHPAAGDQRRHPQPLRAGPRPGPGRPVDLPAGVDRR